MLGIPIGVHASFLLIALFGATAYRGTDIALWTIAAFVAILLHELGHAVTARAFGAVGTNVTLYGLGGLTQYRHGSGMGHGRSFVVSAAGSAVGIVTGGAVLLAARQGVFDGAPAAAVVFLDSFVFAALVWGILNWVPIVPLDGGHMVQHLAAMVNEERAPLIGQIVTWIAVAIVVPIALMNGYVFAAIFVPLFALMGVREYQQATRGRRVPTSPPPNGQTAERPDAEPPKPPPEFPI